MTRKEIKTLAKEKLKGRWTNIVLLTLILAIIEIVASQIAAEYSILSFANDILLVPAITAVGVIYVIKFVSSSKKVSLNEAIPSVNMWIRFIKMIVIVAICTIPVIIVVVFGEVLFITMASTMHAAMFMGGLPFDPVMMIWIMAGGIALIGILLGSIVGVFLFPLSYLVAEEEIGVWKATCKSVKIMKGHKWELFVIGLSFLGWGLLSILTFGIGLLWLLPYIQVTFRTYYLSITGRIDEIR